MANDGIAKLALAILLSLVQPGALLFAFIVVRDLVKMRFPSATIDKTSFFRRALAKDGIAKLALAILASFVQPGALLFAFIVVRDLVKMRFPSATIDKTSFFRRALAKDGIAKLALAILPSLVQPGALLFAFIFVRGLVKVCLAVSARNKTFLLR
jgi:hypothetical protein